MDEDEVVDGKPDQTERPGARAAAANALIAERIRNNPPPSVGVAPAPAGSPPAGEGSERGAPPPARADGHPSEEGPKPTEAHTEDSWRKFVNERHGGDEEKAKQAVFETDSRAAALARENAELKAQRDGKPTGSADDKPPTPPAPELTEEKFTQQLAADQAAFVKDDAECGRLVAQYQKVEPEAKKYGIPTEDGRFVGGTIEQIEEELKLEARNLERGKVGGHELDEVEKSELKDIVRELKEKLRDEKDAANARWMTLRRLEARWDHRVNAFQKSFKQSWAEQAQAQVRERTSADAAIQAARDWDTAFTPLKEGLSEPDADRLETQLLLRASASLHAGEDMEDLDAWLTEAAEKVRADWAELRGEADRTRTQRQIQDTRRPAPGGLAAVAPEPAALGTARERRRAADRYTSQRLREAAGISR